MATHLRVKALPSMLATGLPIRLDVTAVDETGETDTGFDGSVEVSSCLSLVDDNFEDGELGAWKLGCNEDCTEADEGLTCTVIKAPPHGHYEGTKCMCLKGGVGDAKIDRNWAKGCKRALNNIRPTRMTFHVLSNSNEQESGVLFLTGSSDRVCLVFSMRADGRMGIEDELLECQGELSRPYQPNTWYDIEFVFDWGTKVFDFLINREVVGSRVPFENKRVDSLGKVFVSNSNLSSETCWDKFWMIEESSGPSVMCKEAGTQMRDGHWFGYCEVLQEAKHIALRVKAIRSGDNESVHEGRSTEFETCTNNCHAVEIGNVSSFCKDILDLIDDETVSDLTLVVEGRKVHVNRAILCARCLSFRSMLTSGMIESRLQELEMKDVSYKPFYALVEYIYSGNTRLDPEMATQVLALADRFICLGLKRICEAVLIPSITLDSVVNLLEASDLYTATELQQACLSFVVANFGSIVQTPEYEHLDRRLMLLVQRALAQHMTSPKASPAKSPRASPAKPIGNDPAVRGLQLDDSFTGTAVNT